MSVDDIQKKFQKVSLQESKDNKISDKMAAPVARERVCPATRAAEAVISKSVKK